MTQNEIIDAITSHLDNDTQYKMIGIENKMGDPVLGHNVTFDICNSVPKDFFAPYFEVENIDQAKSIIKEVLERENNYDVIPTFEMKFDTILSSKNMDFNNKLFLSIYKPDRY